jgi:hypothetical protein
MEGQGRARLLLLAALSALTLAGPASDTPVLEEEEVDGQRFVEGDILVPDMVPDAEVQDAVVANQDRLWPLGEVHASLKTCSNVYLDNSMF